MIRIVWRFHRDRVPFDLLAGVRPEAIRDLNVPSGLRVTPVFFGARETLQAEVNSLPAWFREEESNDPVRYYQTYVEGIDDLPLVVPRLDRALAEGVITYYDLQSDIGAHASLVEQEEPDPTNCERDRGPEGPDRRWDHCQLYLNSSQSPGPTRGVGARQAWLKRGGKGDGIRIVDLEEGWNQRHQDLIGKITKSFGDFKAINHGTAVLGILAADHANNIGVQGMVPAARLGVAPFQILENDDLPNPEGILQKASRWLRPGDVLLVEVQAIRPDTQGASAFEPFLPIEAWEHGRTALKLVHARSAYVVEAAGNGGLNLDEVNGVPSTGAALMVGAGNPQTGKAIPRSNRGARVDLQGWGRNVVTTGSAHGAGYASLQRRTDNRCYTKTFSGTSSAAAIVAGCVAALSGILKAHGFDPLSAADMKALLIATGSFPDRTANRDIGPLPDLEKAVQSLEDRLQAQIPGFSFQPA